MYVVWFVLAALGCLNPTRPVLSVSYIGQPIMYSSATLFLYLLVSFCIFLYHYEALDVPINAEIAPFEPCC